MASPARLPGDAPARRRTSPIPRSGRPSDMSTRRPLALSVMALLVVAFAGIVVPPIVVPDAPAPARIAPYVDAGRDDLRANIDGLPPHLRFVEARCRADGGVMLIYEQWAPPYLTVPYAYVMSGRWPPQGWAGGANSHDLARDPEVAAFFGSSEVPCE